MPSTRRTTLAAINRPRKSMGISRNNEPNIQNQKKNIRPTTKDRKSMMPRVPGEMASPLLKVKMSNGGKSINSVTPSRRKSSDKRQALARNDPRSIGDKEYQLTCIRNLLQYLTDGGYENIVSVRSLSCPSGKDFNQILTFMVRKIDPTFNDGSTKFEDEAVLFFRQLNYPYTMSKTSLVAAGSPHTWPTLLAALNWLVEYLKVYANDEETPESEHPIVQLMHKSNTDFFRYVGVSYEAFIKAEDDYSNELEQHFIEDFEQGNLYVEQENVRTKEQNNDIAAEIESLESLARPAESRQKMEQLCAELESCEQIHSDLLEHKETLQQRVTSKTQELQKLEKQVAKNKSNIATLKKSVKTQNLSQDDMKRMRNEIACLRDTLDRTAVSRTEIQKLACEHDERFQLKINNLKHQVKECNTITERCQQNLPYNHAQRNKEFVLYVDSTQAQNYRSDPSKLFGGINVQQYAIPTYMNMRDDFCSQVDENKRSLVTLASQKQSTEISIIDASEKSKVSL